MILTKFVNDKVYKKIDKPILSNFLRDTLQDQK